jgi:hypothetical protein
MWNKKVLPLKRASLTKEGRKSMAKTLTKSWKYSIINIYILYILSHHHNYISCMSNFILNPLCFTGDHAYKLPKSQGVLAFIEYYSVLFGIWLTWKFEPVRYVSHMAHLGHKGLISKWMDQFKITWDFQVHSFILIYSLHKAIVDTSDSLVLKNQRECLEFYLCFIYTQK